MKSEVIATGTDGFDLSLSSLKLKVGKLYQTNFPIWTKSSCETIFCTGPNNSPKELPKIGAIFMLVETDCAARPSDAFWRTIRILYQGEIWITTLTFWEIHDHLEGPF